ncbi:VUT family protein [Sorangium sp. So ce281]|uniref:VUT family protein n=1 Tax=unclassified Sorangium TaxID=2621164 RepID=UPI003F5E6982
MAARARKTENGCATQRASPGSSLILCPRRRRPSRLAHRVREAYLRKSGPRRQWLAVLASNAVSVPVDNLLFCFGAFAFVLPFEVIRQIFAINLATKFAMTLISLPGIYLVPDKKSEGAPGLQA